MKDYIFEIKKLVPNYMCKKIISYFDNSFQDAAITGETTKGAIVKNIRNCTFRNILNTKTFGEKLILNYIKSKLFEVTSEYQKKFDFLSIEGISQIDLLKYETNNYDAGYKYHVDMGPKSMPRHLSISICLNNNFTGGEFKFNLNGVEVQIPQNIGDAIAFPSNFMFPHQVNKILTGTRYAIIGWVV